MYKKLYQTPLSLNQKRCINWYNFLFSISLGFVIPNSSNHCTRQLIFIMYSYAWIMLYFCMRQNFFCHSKRVASVPSHPPNNSTTPHLILPLMYYPFATSLTPPQPTAGQDPPPQVQKKRDSIFCWSTTGLILSAVAGQIKGSRRHPHVAHHLVLHWIPPFAGRLHGWGAASIPPQRRWGKSGVVVRYCWHWVIYHAPINLLVHENWHHFDPIDWMWFLTFFPSYHCPFLSMQQVNINNPSWSPTGRRWRSGNNGQGKRRNGQDARSRRRTQNQGRGGAGMAMGSGGSGVLLALGDIPRPYWPPGAWKLTPLLTWLIGCDF